MQRCLWRLGGHRNSTKVQGFQGFQGWEVGVKEMKTILQQKGNTKISASKEERNGEKPPNYWLLQSNGLGENHAH